jgi:predicted permease
MAEDDLAREMAAHLASLEDEYRRRGLTPDDARLAARRAMGSVAYANDLHRDARSFGWLDDLQRDARHAVRMLVRAPGFTTVALLTLALGIGATTAVFSVVHGVLLTPLPYPEPDRLVRVFGPPPTVAGIDGPPSRLVDLPSQTYQTLRLTDRAFSHVAGYVPITFTMTGQGEAVRLVGSQVSAAVFPMLGIRPLLGRTFVATEEAAGADAVVVLSEAAWRRYFNADGAAIGQVIALDGRGRMVIGVMPAGFSQIGMHFPDPQAQFWVPYVPPPDSRNRLGVALMARLAPGVPLPVAEDIVNGAVGEPGQGRFQLSRVHDEIVRPVKPALLILSVAVGLVLLVACVNVANLLLARTATRELEIAVRRAVGAARGRLIRQLLAESALLSLVGGLIGTIVAFGGVSLLRLLATSLNRRDLTRGANLPRLDQIGIDGSVLAFTIGVALFAGLLFGLIPAIRQSRQRDADLLREKQASHGVRGTLVVAEIAMAVMLLVGGGLLIHSFLRLSTVERGYTATNVLTFQAAPQGTSRTEGMAFADRLVERLASLPGVAAAGYSNNLPLIQQGFSRDVSPRPLPPGTRAPRPYPSLHAVSPGFFEALGLRLVEGRTFSSGEAGRREALVSRAFARSGFFDGPALGRPIYAGKTSWEVVGIVEDVRQFNLDQPPGSEMFIIDFISAPPGFWRDVLCRQNAGRSARDRGKRADDRPRARFLRDCQQRGDDGADRLECDLGSSAVRSTAGDLCGRRRDAGGHRHLRCPRVQRHAPDSRDRDSDGPWGAADCGGGARRATERGAGRHRGHHRHRWRGVAVALFAGAAVWRGAARHVDVCGRRNRFHARGARGRVSACAAGHAGGSVGRAASGLTRRV